MNEREALVKVAAVLTTLRETDGGPESSLYLACGANLSDWECVKFIMTRAGLATFAGNWARLTELGNRKADEINARLAAR